MLYGIDVSHHQGRVDWDAVAASGQDFAIVKATEGTTFVDSQFERNWKEIARVGLVRGAYHFLRDTGDPAVQARHFVSVVGSFSRAVVVLDVETGGTGGSSKPGINHVRAFVREFRRLIPGHPLVIYTGAWYWIDTIGNPFGADIGPLWHSEYDTGSAEITDGPERDSYGGWPGCLIWQFTSSGSVPGVTGNCDRNIFYGDRHRLHALGLDSQEAPDLDATQNTRLANAERDAKAAKANTDKIVKLLTDDNLDRSPASRAKESLILLRALAARDNEANLTEEDKADLIDALISVVPDDIANQVLDGLAARISAKPEIG